ncbi:Nn.00g063740.m01.CDS01 [Neocucurbitaria sp. VM-36]
MHYLHQHSHMHHHVRREAHVAASSTGSRIMVEAASRVITARADSTCTSDSDAGCTKPTQVPSIAIALAVIVPVVGLLVVLLFLHRRNKRKLREEDAKDKYKSLDFGMAPGEGGAKRGKKGPEMSVTEKEIRGGHDRGLSLETGSPYILPVGLHGSRESFHSLSRSQVDPHDPYRPVTFLNDGQSIRSQSRTYRNETGSMYTTSSGGTSQHRMNDGLLKNAQRMSTSYPMRGESLSPDGSKSPDVKFPEPARTLSPLNPLYENESLPGSAAPPAASAEPEPEYAAFKASPIPTIQVPEPAVTNQEVSKSPVQTTPSPSAFPPRIQSQQAVVHENANTTSIISTSSYGDGFQVTPPSPRQSEAQQEPLAPNPRYPQGQQNVGLGVDDFGRNTNRLSMSLRPLPSDDPEENPEQRANRIRSFYKEYFDDSKPEPVGGHTYTDYYEDYGSEYQDGTMFDSRNGNFVVAQPNAPYAEPITRRAMTPPPRAPPRFRSNTGPRGPHMSGSSNASSQYPPRNMSSMSGRLPPPRKALPPPSTLSSLPTPAKLTENSMVFDPIDFAPPVSFRERQNGIRPDSPLGSPRPYSPSVRPHTPLVGAFDDLAVMPSPHALRKSSTFTALDFAPPPRFRDPGSNASDAGSIRSNRSGMSAAGKFAVRSGANRVSRIPRGVVGTRDDFMVQLRPQMDLVAKA